MRYKSGSLVLLIAILAGSLALTAPPPAAATTDPYADAVTASGPKGWWRLNESSGTTAVDSSGSGRNGTSTGTTTMGEASWGWDGAGATGAAARFDRSGLITLPSMASDLNSSRLSAECWVYVARLPAASRCFKVGDVELGVGTYGTASESASFKIKANLVPITAPITVGWHHLAATYNVTGSTQRLYIDGTQVVSANYYSDAVVTPATGQIGGDGTLGRIDEVAFYNKALTATEITDHFNAGKHPRPAVTITKTRRVFKLPETGNHGVFLEWDPYTAFSPTGYKIYRDGQYVKTVTDGLTFIDLPDAEMTGGWSVVAYNATEESADTPSVRLSPHFRWNADRNGDRVDMSTAALRGVSADQRFALWQSPEPLSGESVTAGRQNLFREDRATGEFKRLNDATGGELNTSAGLATLSADGRYAGLLTAATDIEGATTGSDSHAYRWAIDTGKVDRLDGDLGATGGYLLTTPQLSADGRHAVFSSSRQILANTECPYVSSLQGGAKLYSTYFEGGGAAPFTSFVTSGAPSSSCETEVKAVSQSGRYVLAAGRNRSTFWLVDRDSNEAGGFDEPGTVTRAAVSLGTGYFNASQVRETTTGVDFFVQFYDDTVSGQKIYKGSYDKATGAATTSLVTISSNASSGSASASLTMSDDSRYVAYLKREAYYTVGITSQYTNRAYVLDRDSDADGVFDEAGSTTTTRMNWPVLPAAPADSTIGQLQLSFDGRFLLGATKDDQFLQDEDRITSSTPANLDYINWDLRPGEPVPDTDYTQTQAYKAATRGYIADPIDAATGNFLHTEPLLDFNGPASALTATGFYAHQDPHSGGLGASWTMPTDMQLTETASVGPLVDIRTQTGDHILYRPTSGGWTPITAGDSSVLTETSSGWERTHTDGAVETFDGDGWWTGTTYPDSSTIEVTRNSSGQATHVEHSTGYGYDLTWTSGRVTKMTADDGRVTTLHYTGGVLDTITRNGFRAVMLDHDAAGRITEITQSDGRAQRGLEFTQAATSGSGTWLSAGNWTPSRTALTAETWFQLDSALPGGSGMKVLLSKHGTTGTSGEYQVGLLNSGGVSFLTRASSTSADTYTASATIAPGVPHHLAVTWNGTTKRIYLDGVELGSGKTWSGTMATTTIATRLSVPETTGTNQGFVGTLDDVALYGTALTTTQVAKHHQLGTDPVPGENYADDGPRADGAAAYWRFNGLRNEIPGAPKLSGTATYDDGLLVDNVTTRRLLTTSYDDRNRALDQVNASGGHTTIDYKLTPTSSTRPNVTESTDAVSGDVTRFEMLTDGTVAQETTADGTTRARTVTDGRLAGLSEAGATLAMAHDPVTGVLNELTSTDGTEIAFTYDDADRPVEVTANGDPQLMFTYATADTSPSARIDRQPTAITDAAGKTTTFDYTTVGGAKRLTGTTDPDGVTTTYAYDSHGQLASSTLDPAGADLTTTWTYTAAGQIATVTLPGDRTWTYTYDAAGRTTMVTDPAGEDATTTYTALGDLATSTDRTGGVTSYTWRDDGLLESVTDPDGIETSYGYNGNGELTSTTNAAGTTTYELGPMRRIDKVTDPTGIVTTYTYDEQGRVLTATKTGGTGGGDDQTTTYTYDPAGNLLTVTDPEGGVTTRTYTATSQPATVTDPTGVVTTWTYDALDRHHTETVGDATTTWAYTSGGRLASVTDPDGVVVDYDYDLAGRLSSIDNEGSATELTYDTAGDLTERSDAGAVTTYERDSLGQVTSSDGPAGQAASTFDPEGRVLTYTRGDGTPTEGTWTYAYTDAGRLESATDPVGTTSTYGYDAVGLEHTRTVGTEVQATKAYDAAGHLTIDDRLAAGETTFTYDVYGRLATSTDASGRTTTFTRDGNGRTVGTVDTKTGLPTLTTTNTYDDAGRPTSVTDAGGTTTWTWATEPAAGPGDPAPTGLLTSRLDPAGELAYGWTDAGRMASRTVAPATGPPQTEEFTYTDGRLTTREDATGTSTYTWTDGRLAAEALPGLDRTRTYDTDGRLTGTTEDDGTDTIERTVSYDAWGRPSEATTGTETTEWAYDAAGQLTGETHGGTSTQADRTWTFDDGRLTADTTGTETRTWTWDDGRAVTVDIGTDTVALTYDGAGRQTGWSGAGVTVDRTYDAGGNVAAVTRDDGTTVTDETRAWHNSQLSGVTVDDGTTSSTRSFWHDDGNLAPGPSTLGDPTIGPLTAVVATADTTGDWTLAATGPLTGGPGGPNAPPTVSADLFGTPTGTPDVDAYGSGGTADSAGDLSVHGAQAVGIGGLDLTAAAPVVHIGARDSDAGLFTTPDPLDAVTGTGDVANAYAAHGNAPTVTWDASGLRPDYSGNLTAEEFFTVAAMVPGPIGWTAAGALCATSWLHVMDGKSTGKNAAVACVMALAVPYAANSAFDLGKAGVARGLEWRAATLAEREAASLATQAAEHEGAALAAKAVEDVSAAGAGEVALVNGRRPINSSYAGDVFDGATWTPELAAKYPAGVRFKSNGFPDFEPYAEASVQLDGLTGAYRADEKLANAASGRLRTDPEHVWHHVEDGRTMLLVPQDVHQGVRHTGGAAILKGTT